MESEEPYHEEATPVEGGSREEPYVEVHASGTDIKVGEEVILTLSAINPITSPSPLVIQLTLAIPEGWSVTTSGFNYAGAGGLWTSTYTIEQGPNLRAIYVHLIPNRTGRNRVVAYADYYFSERPEQKNRVSKVFTATIHASTENKGDGFFFSCSGRTRTASEPSANNSPISWALFGLCWVCLVACYSVIRWRKRK